MPHCTTIAAADPPGFLQAVATIAAAALVLAGVLLTLWHNSRRLLHERLAERAKSRHAELCRLYADFAAAYFERLSQTRRIKGLLKLRRSQRESTHLAPDGGAPAITRTESLIFEVRNAKTQTRAQMTTAYTRLLLIDDEPTRLRAMSNFLDDLASWTDADKDALLEQRREKMAAYLTQVGDALEREYRTNAHLASKGRQPERPAPAANIN